MPKNDPNSPDLSQGPFSEALSFKQTEREPTYQAPAIRPSGYMGAGGQLAMIASKFLEGAAQGRARAFHEKEMEKFAHVRNYQRVLDTIMAGPYTAEFKERAQQEAMKNMFGPVNEALNGKGGKSKGKDAGGGPEVHPLVHQARSILGGIAGSILGPGENKANRDIDGNTISSLIGQMSDPKNHLNPGELIGGTVNTIQQVQKELAEAGQKSGVEVNRSTVMADPRVQKALAGLQREGIPPEKIPQLQTVISGIPEASTPESREAIKDHESLRRERDARTGAITAQMNRLTPGVVMVDGKATSVLRDPNTGQRFDAATREAISIADPRAAGPVLSEKDYGMLQRASQQKAQVQVDHQGHLLQYDPQTKNWIPATDDDHNVIKMDTPLGKAMASAAAAEGRLVERLAHEDKREEARRGDKIEEDRQKDLSVASKIKDPNERARRVQEINAAADRKLSRGAEPKPKKLTREEAEKKRKEAIDAGVRSIYQTILGPRGTPPPPGLGPKPKAAAPAPSANPY